MGQHYFSRRPEAPSRPGRVDVVLADVYLRLRTDRGVFSPDRLDPGTRILLDAVPPPPRAGDLLDLGCGYGPVALAMAARAPGARVWAVDVNERALELCRGNAEAAGLANVRCVPPAGVDPAVELAALWSNPPIRIGKPALHGLLAGWLRRLAAGATGYLVVQRHLGADSLHRWLAEQGWAVDRVAARSGYRVLAVTPRTGGAG